MNSFLEDLQEHDRQAREQEDRLVKRLQKMISKAVDSAIGRYTYSASRSKPMAAPEATANDDNTALQAGEDYPETEEQADAAGGADIRVDIPVRETEAADIEANGEHGLVKESGVATGRLASRVASNAPTPAINGDLGGVVPEEVGQTMEEEHQAQGEMEVQEEQGQEVVRELQGTDGEDVADDRRVAEVAEEVREEGQAVEGEEQKIEEDGSQVSDVEESGGPAGNPVFEREGTSSSLSSLTNTPRSEPSHTDPDPSLSPARLRRGRSRGIRKRDGEHEDEAEAPPPKKTKVAARRPVKPRK